MAVQPPTQPTPEDPHEGSEDDPRRELDSRDGDSVVPPRRYEGPDPAGAVDRPLREPTVLDRLESASVPLAIIAFFVLGFGTGLWYVAWVVFLVPPALSAWNRPSRKR